MLYAHRRSLTALAATVATALLAALLVVPVSTSTAEAGTAAAPRWTTYVPSTTGIPGDYVYSLAFGPDGKAWVTADDPIWDDGGLGRLDNPRRWSQWTNVDGSSVTHDMTALQFGPDGAAWAASALGLLRFDGKRVEVVWNRSNAPWPVNHVHDFGWTSNGDLWVALGEVSTVRGGVARYDGDDWKVWTTANGLPWEAPWDQVWALEVGPDDRVWIGSPVMGGAVWTGSHWQALGEGDGTWVNDIRIADGGTPWFSFANWGVRTWSGSAWIDRTPAGVGLYGVSLVEVDRKGRVWLGTFVGQILRWSGSGATYDLTYEPPSLTSHIYGLAFDKRNRPYVGGIGGLDIRRADGSWMVHSSQTTALPSRWIEDIMITDSGTRWFSTSGGGIGVNKKRTWTGYNPANHGQAPWPFSTDSSEAAVEDPDGVVWVAPTNDGIGAWDGEEWTAHLPGRSFTALAVGPDGDLWAAPIGGPVQRWTGSRWVAQDNPTGAASLNAIAVDPAGDVWLGSDVGLHRLHSGSWTTYTPGDSGLPAQRVLSIEPDPADGSVWIGTDGGLARFDGDAGWTVYTMAADGIPADVVSSIAVAPNGHVWIGAFDPGTWPYPGGIARFNGTKWKTWTAASSPLPHNQVQAINVDDRGAVWIATASEGAARFRPR